MTPARGLNQAQQEALKARNKALQDARNPPRTSGGGGSGSGGFGGFGPQGPNKPSKPADSGGFGPQGPNKPSKPAGFPSLFRHSGYGGGPMGMKKGGMATKKKAGKISEYGGKEMYSSKKGMMKHEGMESMKMEKSEGMKMRGGGMAAKGKGLAMKKGGMAPKGRGMAIMIAIGKPKGRGKS